MNSPVTRERYSTRLRSFFVHIGVEGATMEERCHFVARSRMYVFDCSFSGVSRLNPSRLRYHLQSFLDVESTFPPSFKTVFFLQQLPVSDYEDVSK